jgi:hypothetical protein
MNSLQEGDDHTHFKGRVREEVGGRGALRREEKTMQQLEGHILDLGPSKEEGGKEGGGEEEVVLWVWLVGEGVVEGGGDGGGGREGGEADGGEEEGPEVEMSRGGDGLEGGVEEAGIEEAEGLLLEDGMCGGREGGRCCGGWLEKQEEG